jgi:hypothetical protein
VRSHSSRRSRCMNLRGLQSYAAPMKINEVCCI